VILFGQKSALVFAVQLSAISRFANNARYNAQVLTALQIDKESSENDFDEPKPRKCVVDEELYRMHNTVQEYFQNSGMYFGRQRSNCQ